MNRRPAISSIPYLLLAESGPLLAGSGFSYKCGGCAACCTGNRIRINPYEALLLSRFLGISTTEFIRRCTTSNGSELARTESGSCVFLHGRSCSVHGFHPLVCRLYPLARSKKSNSSYFTLLDPRPETTGEYGTCGTVAKYVREQGAEPLLSVMDRYLNIFEEALEAAPHLPLLRFASAEAAGGSCEQYRAWFDIDYALSGSKAAGSSGGDALNAHLALLQSMLRALSAGRRPDGDNNG